MSLINDIQQGFIDAMDDIRHSVVEQGWFGQETTDNISTGNAEIATP